MHAMRVEECTYRPNRGGSRRGEENVVAVIRTPLTQDTDTRAVDTLNGERWIALPNVTQARSTGLNMARGAAVQDCPAPLRWRRKQTRMGITGGGGRCAARYRGRRRRQSALRGNRALIGENAARRTGVKGTAQFRIDVTD